MKLFILIIIAIIGIAFEIFHNKRTKKRTRKFVEFSESTQEKIKSIKSNELTELKNEIEKITEDRANQHTTSEYIPLDDFIIYSKKRIKRFYDTSSDVVRSYPEKKSVMLAEDYFDLHAGDLEGFLKEKQSRKKGKLLFLDDVG